MPKNEGGTPEKKQYKISTGTKVEPVETIPTYFELGVDKKDTSRWQQMIEHEEEIKEKEIREKRIVTILQLHMFCFDVIFIA